MLHPFVIPILGKVANSMLVSFPWVRSEETGLRHVGVQPGVAGLRPAR
jgi:hypothetical protein